MLTECPIIVVLLLKLYPKLTDKNVKRFTPVIIDTLFITAPANTPKRARYQDFIAAQVKVPNSHTVILF